MSDVARRAQEACPACGYDLRATSARCPECGVAEAATLLTALETAPGHLEKVAADPAKVAECAAWWNERWVKRFCDAR